MEYRYSIGQTILFKTNERTPIRQGRIISAYEGDEPVYIVIWIGHKVMVHESAIIEKSSTSRGIGRTTRTDR